MTDPFQLQDPFRAVDDETGRAELRERADNYRKLGRSEEVLDIYWRLSDWQRMADYLMELERPVEAGTAWLRLLPFLPVRADTLTRVEAMAAREAARCYASGGMHRAGAGLLLNLGDRDAAIEVLRAGDLTDEIASVEAHESLAGNPWPGGMVSSRTPAGARDGAETSEHRVVRLGSEAAGPDPAADDGSGSALDALVQVPVGDPHYLDVADLVARLAFQHGLMSAKVALFLEPLLSGEGLDGRQPDADTVYRLGRLHERIGITEKATVAYAHALAINPTHRASAVRSARLKNPQGGAEDAVDAFSKSMEMGASEHDREQLRARVVTTTTEFNLGPLVPGSEVAGRFLLEDPIGEGGCGVVFSAQDHQTGKRVALKILRSGAGELRAVQRFQREIEISKGLRHPNVVETMDSGEWRDLHWISMERLDGIDLGVLLRRIGRPLPVGPSIRVLRQTLEGLSHAHDSGVIHRDIKPSNIFVLRKTHNIKLLDFGLAFITNATRFTRAGTTVGSPRYMAPERLRGDVDFGPWSDLYALGVVVHRMLTATMPFKEKDLVQLLAEIRSVDPPPPSTLNSSVPPELDAMVAKLLSKEPLERYRAAGEVLADLDPLEHRLAAERGTKRN
ncbi:MAG: serine/threonine protein kinase [Deltaproteobacteria bacterium]|nr:serine/threonine protein kinase [Deltaproteobacteria bacterium]